MTQTDFGTINPNTKSGTQLATDLNAFRTTLYSQHLGGSVPSYVVGGMLWADNTSADFIVRQYDGADSIPIWQLDATSNLARVALDADEDSYIVMGKAGDDILSIYLNSAEGYRLTAAGMRFGAGPPRAALDLADKTSSLRLPVGTTAQRTGSPANGDIRYNTTTGGYEGYKGAAWVPLSGAPLASPAFTDTPTAPTAAAETDTDQLATTAFVQQALAAGLGATGAPAFVLEDQRSAGTGGGDSTTSWSTRGINTEVRDIGSKVSLSSSEFTVTADCWVEWEATFFQTLTCQTRVYNVTDSAVVKSGTSGTLDHSDRTMHTSTGGAALISGKTYRLEARALNARPNGFGPPANLGETEVHARIKGWLI